MYGLAITFEKKLAGFSEYNDSSNESVRKTRIEGKLDMLLHRKKALEEIIKKSDIYSLVTIRVELLKQKNGLSGRFRENGFTAT